MTWVQIIQNNKTEGKVILLKPIEIYMEINFTR